MGFSVPVHRRGYGGRGRSAQKWARKRQYGRLSSGGYVSCLIVPVAGWVACSATTNSADGERRLAVIAEYREAYKAQLDDLPNSLDI